MRFLALAAFVSLAGTACSQNPLEPQAASVAKKSTSTVSSPTVVCKTQRDAVSSLRRRVDYLTTGAVRTALLEPLDLAYDALSPAACRPADAIAELERFITLVNDNAESISPSVVTYFITAANSIIGYLRPIA